MSIMRTVLLPILLAAALAGCADQAPRTASRDCGAIVRDALAARGVDPATITSTTFYVQRDTEAPAVQDRTVWVRTNACQGYLVARIDAGCSVIELFPTGGCALPPPRS